MVNSDESADARSKRKEAREAELAEFIRQIIVTCTSTIIGTRRSDAEIDRR